MMEIPLLLPAPLDLALVLFVAAIVPWLIVWRYSSRSSIVPAAGRPLLNRSFSFTSLASLLGPFPEKAHVAETIINTAIFYDDCPTLEDLENDVIKPMLQYERLATQPQIPSSWINNSHNNNNNSNGKKSRAAIQPKDMRRHVIINGNDNLTHETINQHLLDSLEEKVGKPWWEFIVIENQGNGKSVLLLRIHHGLADGMSLVKVFETILTDEHGYTITSPLLQHASSSQRRQRSGSSKGGGFQQTISMLWSILCAVLETVSLPSSRFDCDIFFSRNPNGQKNKQMLIMSNSSTGNNNNDNSIVVSPILLPIVPLDYIKKLKNAASVTVNDILMTAVSQAIRDYCLDQNCPVLLQQLQESQRSNNKYVQCRALLPVALPKPRSKKQQHEDNEKATALSNSWCMASIDLCLGIDDIEQRLRMIHTKTMTMKTSPTALVTMWIQNTLGPYLPFSISRQTLYDTFCRHSLVFSNVPGPHVKCILAGKVVTSVQMFYPNLIPQVGLLSYAGNVHGNIIIVNNMNNHDNDNQAQLLPKPQLLAKFYAAALIDLGKRLLVNLDETAASPPKDLVVAATAAVSGA